MKTAYSFIQSSVAEALGLPRTDIQSDILAQGVDYYNMCGRMIWDSLFWNNRLVDQYDVSPVSGVITFDATVDLILAVRSKTTNATIGLEEGQFIWAEDQVNAAIKGNLVSEQRWTLLSDVAATGARRIKLNEEVPDTDVYTVLVTKRFVEATIESAYSSTNPSATPTDYRVIQWSVDFADMALQAFMTDRLRIWQNQQPTNEWKMFLQQAVDKAKRQMQREDIAIPADVTFDEVGDFYK